MRGSLFLRIRAVMDTSILLLGGAHQAHRGAHHGAHFGSSHGKANEKKTPFLFLFSLGLSPCVAVLPVVAKAAVEGSVATFLTLISFSLGVVLALISATSIVSLGLVKLDHPVFEHYGDVLAGIGVSLMGGILFLMA